MLSTSKSTQRSIPATSIYQWHRISSPLTGAEWQPEWSAPQEAFEDAYAHEQKISKMTHDLVNLANQEKDHASFTMLQWFVQEQVEEENSTGTIADQIKKIKDSPNGLFMLDHALGQRKGE